MGLIGCSVITGWLIQPAVAAGKKGGGNPRPTPVLSQVEIADLLFMREEEKLAHDVYVTLYAEWGSRVFDNISESEQTHTDAVLGLLDTYGLQDPALEFGNFANHELQVLYDTLVEVGLESKLEALMVGALIEEVDMEDIVAAMERTDQSNILTVYGNLLAGSESHLNAFVRNIEGITGELYVAQYLKQEDVDAILGR